MPSPKKLLETLYGVSMQDGGKPPKRGVSSLPGYGEGIDDPTTQALLAIRRNLGEAGRAAVGVKPYDETNPTETYRAMQALFNAPTPAAIIPEAGQAAGKAATALSGLGALGVVKPKGGNWVIGSVERGLRQMKQRFAGDTIDPSNLIPVPNRPPEYPGMMYRSEDGGGIIVNPEEVSRLRALGEINNWIDTKLGKYVRNELGTPEDPVRALAERGVLHFTPQGGAVSAYTNRKMLGMPTEPTATSPLAQSWEDVADATIRGGPYLEKLPMSVNEAQIDIPETLRQLGGEYAVQNPEALAYELNRGVPLSEGLGFRHLIDELRNATNPDSGLPRSLQLSPDKLQKVTVPQAVELVDKINKWRAEQKVAADLKRSQNAATVEYKAYDTIPGTAEPNQRGLRWVELRAPTESLALPKGYSIQTSHGTPYLQDEKGQIVQYLDDANGVDAAAKKVVGRMSLEDALKYEGEVMGHCVGGYCPDVESGRSRIYSLRDAKGEPHVTIEVQPYPYAPRWEVVKEYLPQAEEMMRARGITNAREEEVSELATQLAKENMPSSIQQIKGKANRAPKDEYLPFVQDFVRSGQWSSVGDLGNTGLIRKSDYIDTFTPEMLDSVGVGEYMTKEEFNQLADKLGGINKMAAGGAVNIQNNRKVRISDNPDTMRLELLRKKHA